MPDIVAGVVDHHVKDAIDPGGAVDQIATVLTRLTQTAELRMRRARGVTAPGVPADLLTIPQICDAHRWSVAVHTMEATKNGMEATSLSSDIVRL